MGRSGEASNEGSKRNKFRTMRLDGGAAAGRSVGRRTDMRCGGLRRRGGDGGDKGGATQHCCDFLRLIAHRLNIETLIRVRLVG